MGNKQQAGAQKRNIAGKGSGGWFNGTTLGKMLTMFSCSLISHSPKRADRCSADLRLGARQALELLVGRRDPPVCWLGFG